MKKSNKKIISLAVVLFAMIILALTGTLSNFDYEQFLGLVDINQEYENNVTQENKVAENINNLKIYFVDQTTPNMIRDNIAKNLIIAEI